MTTATLPIADTSSYPNEEVAVKKGYTISTACERSVLIRPCFGGEAVQLCIIGKRGGIQEAVSFNATQLPGVIGALERAGEEAEREWLGEAKVAEDNQLDRLAAVELAAKATHCPKGHLLDAENTYRRGNGKGCRTCRREGNAWTLEGGRLRLKTEAERVGVA